MLPAQEIMFTQYNRRKVKCLQCSHIFTSKDPDCPQKGDFGIYLLVYITILKFHLRGVLRKIQDFLLYEDNFEISFNRINDVLLRVGDACKNEYDLKLKKIRNAKLRHIDETGFKVNGEKRVLISINSQQNITFGIDALKCKLQAYPYLKINLYDVTYNI